MAIAFVVAAVVSPPLRQRLRWVAWAWQPGPETLPVPVDGVKARQVADTWGGIRSGGRKHRGVDIFAPRGTPVRSTTAGVVTRVGTVSLGGNAVWILGPGLRIHYYAHLDRFGAFRPGDTVRAGDLLGYVGDTGNARGTPCHLHYGVYRAPGWAINPWPLLADRIEPETPALGS